MCYGSCAGKVVIINDPGGGGGGEKESLCLRYDLTVSSFSTFFDSCYVCWNYSCSSTPCAYICMYLIMYMTYIYTHT